MAHHATVVADSFRPIKNTVFVTDLEAGIRRTTGGIILTDDNMKEAGIRARWGRVFAVGPDVTDLKPGDWVLTKHARWTTGIDFDMGGVITRVWRVDYPEAVLVACDHDPRQAQPVTLA